MKKLILLLTALYSIVLLISCSKKEEEPKPIDTSVCTIVFYKSKTQAEYESLYPLDSLYRLYGGVGYETPGKDFITAYNSGDSIRPINFNEGFQNKESYKLKINEFYLCSILTYTDSIVFYNYKNERITSEVLPKEKSYITVGFTVLYDEIDGYYVSSWNR